MAINFLNTVAFNKNQLKEPVIDNQLNDAAAGTPADGQLYYNTTNDVLKIGEGGVWVSIAGSVTSVDETTPGTSNGTPIVVDPTTGAVTIQSMAFAGDDNVGHVPSSSGETQTTNFLRADGTWAIPSTGDDTKYDFTALQSGGSNSDPILDLDGSDGTNDTVKLIGGTGVTVNRNAGGTEVTFATTADNYDKWVLRDSSDSDSDITTGKFVQFTAATGTAGVTVSGAGTTADPYVMAIKLPNTNTEYTAGTGLTLTGTTFSANVNTTAANDDTVTVSATADRFYAVQLDNNSTAADKKLVVNVPWVDNNSQNTYDLDKAASSTSLILSKNGTTQDTITFQGTTNKVTVTGVTEDAYIFGLPDTVKITTQLDILGSGADALKVAGKAQSDATLGTDVDATLTTKGYVDNLVAGGLQFIGGFNANTGALDSPLTGNLTTGGSRVAVEIGDYYIVTAPGNFYGSVALDTGDSVIAQSNAAAGASVVADWVIVQSDEGVSQITSGNSADDSSGNAITSNSGATGLVTIKSFPFAGAANVGHVPSSDGETQATNFLRADGTWAVPPNTVFTLSTATTSALGGIKLGSDTELTETYVTGTAGTTDRVYPVQLNSDDQAAVNVPWTDTQNADQTISGSGSDNTDSGITLSASGGTVLVLGAGSVTAAQTGNTITLTGVNTQYTAGAGLTLSGTQFAVDYTGTDNFIEEATDLEGTAIDPSDSIVYNDSDDGNVKKGLISDLPFETSGTFRSANVVLNTTTSGVSQQSSPPAGTEGWVVDCSSIINATAINSKCEVITSGGETVYADVTRSGNNLTINFVGSSIAQGTYQALIIKVA